MANPDDVRTWLRLGRDFVVYGWASAIVAVQLYRNAAYGDPPNLSWLGFAAFLFGLVPAIRLDEWIFRSGNGRKHENDR